MRIWFFSRLIGGLSHLFPSLRAYHYDRAHALWDEWNEAEEKRLYQYGLRKE